MYRFKAVSAVTFGIFLDRISSTINFDNYLDLSIRVKECCWKSPNRYHSQVSCKIMEQ